MTTKTRIYRIGHPDGRVRLVRAATVQQAAAHCARELDIRVATQDDLVDAIAAGIKPETAGEQTETQAG